MMPCYNLCGEMSELLDLAIIEQNPIFILDTNALNRLPLPLLDTFDFYCPAGVAREVAGWMSALETLPQRIAEVQKEIEAGSEVLRSAEWVEGFKQEEQYRNISELVERLFLAEKVAELKSKCQIAEWEEAIATEYKRILDDFDRERRSYNLEFAKAILTYALSSGKRIRVEVRGEVPDSFQEYLGGKGDLKVISHYCRQSAQELGLDIQEGEDYLLLGHRGVSEEDFQPFFPYRLVREKKGEIEGEKKRLEELQQKYQDLMNKEEERKNAQAVIDKLSEQGKIIPPKDDWVTSSIRSQIGLLSKTIVADVVKENAAGLARGEKALPLLERALEIYQSRKTKPIEELYEQKFKGKLRAQLSQLLEKIEGRNEEAEILALADEFQSTENLMVDAQVLRAALQKSEEFPQETVFIVTDDSDLIDLFLLCRDLRAKLFQNVKYCEHTILDKFYSRLRALKERLDKLG